MAAAARPATTTRPTRAAPVAMRAAVDGRRGSTPTGGLESSVDSSVRDEVVVDAVGLGVAAAAAARRFSSSSSEIILLQSGHDAASAPFVLHHSARHSAWKTWPHRRGMASSAPSCSSARQMAQSLSPSVSSPWRTNCAERRREA